MSPEERTTEVNFPDVLPDAGSPQTEAAVGTDLFAPERCREVFERIDSIATRLGAHGELEVSVNASREALTRFANNAIHQNVAERAITIGIRFATEQRTARLHTNRLDDESLERAVERAWALARSSEADADLPPMYDGGDDCAAVHRFDAAVAGMTARDRALRVRDCIEVAKSAGQVAAGIYSSGEHVEAIMNRAGLFRYHPETQVQFSITTMAADSSGWAKLTSPYLEGVDAEALTRTAVDKARRSASPRDTEPGDYTVILEPAAVLDLVGQIFPDFSGTALEDQRSFLNDRLGEKLVGSNINIWDHVACPLQAGSPFDGEGVPRQSLRLVESGVPREVAYSRRAAAKAGRVATGHGFAIPNEVGEYPIHIVMAGEDRSIEELVRSTRRGILVSRLWYIREVEPYEKVMTGMTRDGTFLISDGEIAHGIRNLRFNQSVVEMLRNVEALSRSVRASGEESFDMVVPGMKVNSFRFTEQTLY
jgi:PmbA protein